MSATSAQDNAISLARHDPKAALARARTITDPWFRCQALAWVAWLTPDEGAFRPIIAESLKAAQGAADPYQWVGASAWPLRALIERRDGARAVAAIRKALASVPQIENPVSRADAMFLLFQAVFPQGVQVRADTLTVLMSACGAAGTKGQRHLRDAALMLAAVDGATARQVVTAMREGRERRQAERRIAEGEAMEPRAFFWGA